MDILATNRLGRALFTDADGGSFNLARYLFLDPRSQDFYREWENVARDCAAALRTEAGRNPYDRGLTDLVGELSTRSEAFRTWWATHDVKLHYTSAKTMHHAVAGDLSLTGEALHLPGDPGLTIITYTCEPDSPTAQALAFLASALTKNVTGSRDQAALDRGRPQRCWRSLRMRARSRRCAVRTSGWRALALRQRRYACSSRASTVWLG
jgi:anti-sigma factor RsiW